MAGVLGAISCRVTSRRVRKDILSKPTASQLDLLKNMDDAMDTPGSPARLKPGGSSLRTTSPCLVMHAIDLKSQIRALPLPSKACGKATTTLPVAFAMATAPVSWAILLPARPDHFEMAITGGHG